jgi:threonine synthase
LLRAANEQRIDQSDVIVCTVTGHGLKDPQTALADVALAPAVEPEVDAVLRALRG